LRAIFVFGPVYLAIFCLKKLNPEWCSRYVRNH